MKRNFQTAGRTAALLTAAVCLLASAGCSKQPQETSSIVSRPSTVINSEDAQAAAGTRVVSTQFATADTVVAAFNVLDYGADPTGQEDSTNAFRLAMTEASLAGGGVTVWVPAGTYRISSSLTVPKMVTLRGDWQDPDEGTEYGSIIHCVMDSADSTNTGLFVMSTNACVQGLTVYYPEQDINAVKPYPYTFFLPDASLRTIRNVTLINAYRGVGTVHHDVCRIENLKGTVLKEGISLTDGTGAGSVQGVSLSPKYWAGAGKGMNTADADAIERWSKNNRSAGLLLGDAEQYQYADITVQGHYYGIRFPKTETRWMGSGSFFNLYLNDCTYGMYADEGTYLSTRGNNSVQTAIDYRWGYCVSASVIQGERYSIYNGSSSVKGLRGVIKLCGVTLSGATHGNLERTSELTALGNYRLTAARVSKSSGSYFKALPNGSNQWDIQDALNAAGAAGGGTVYLAPGDYEITQPLTVPKNTELRGSAGSSNNLPTSGTVFVVRQSGSAVAQTTQTALVTLGGDNSGVRGIYFLYEDNITSINKSAAYRYYPYTVRGTGKGVWCIDCCINGATHGVDFSNCDNHLISGLISCCLENAMTVGGNQGLVKNCSQIPALLYRTERLETDAATMTPNLVNAILRKYAVYLSVGQSSGQQVVNLFAYGVRDLVHTAAAEQLLAVNLGGDALGDRGVGTLLRCNGGSVTVINSLRYGGDAFVNEGCALRSFNRMSVGLPDEADLLELQQPE